jgi:hypothetical protein
MQSYDQTGELITLYFVFWYKAIWQVGIHSNNASNLISYNMQRWNLFFCVRAAGGQIETEVKVVSLNALLTTALRFIHRPFHPPKPSGQETV